MESLKDEDIVDNDDEFSVDRTFRTIILIFINFKPQKVDRSRKLWTHRYP